MKTILLLTLLALTGCGNNNYSKALVLKREFGENCKIAANGNSCFSSYWIVENEDDIWRVELEAHSIYEIKPLFEKFENNK